MATFNGILNGTKIGVYDGSTLLAYSTSGSLSINHNLRDSSNKQSGGWSESLEGQRDWEISAEGMLAFLGPSASAGTGSAIPEKTVDEMFTAYITTRATLSIVFESPDAGDYQYSGTAWLTSISMDAPLEDTSTWSMSFKGTGALTQTVNS
jgi:predicted secreted protein